MAKNSVFLDSSVLLAAVLSSTGGSFYILSEWRGKFEFLINDYVFEETLKVLDKKFAARRNLKDTLFILIGLASIKIISSPRKYELKTLAGIINNKDAPILSSALEHSSYLLTLDNDFLSDAGTQFSEKKLVLILKPREFIQKFKNVKNAVN